MDSNIGKKLDGRYELIELIGVGGMADIYRAKDIEEDRIVAVKILKTEFAGSDEFLRRFRNESKAIALLSHPNIVKIYDVGFTEKVQFIVMEYVDGITLTDYIEQQGLLKWRDAVHFTIQILRALQHAHDRGIVHRDVKSSNVMLLRDGTIKVMDFGIARFNRENNKTMSEKTIGPVHYISPEQARGDITDERSDIYSVGVALYEMLTGKKPFDGDTPVAIALKHMQSSPKKPTEINETIPEGLEQIVLRAMQKEPYQRYQTAGEMIKDLEEFKKNPGIVFDYKYNSADGSTKYFDHPNSPDREKPRRKKEPDYEEPEEEYEYDEDYDDDDDEYEERRSPLIPILFAVGTAFIICTVFLVLALVSDAFNKDPSDIVNVITGSDASDSISVTDDDEFPMPNLLGLTWEQAQEQYSSYMNLVAQQEWSEVTKGEIFEQEFPESRKIKIGQTVTVKVSMGLKQIEIQDMSNRTVDAAEQQLKKDGFKVSKTYVEDDEVTKDYVIRTDPPAHEMVPQGSTVVLIVSMGPEDVAMFMPNLVTLPYTTAMERCEEYYLIPTVEWEDSEEERGKVLRQSIDPQTRVNRNTEVTLYVSSGEIPEKTQSYTISLPNSATGEFVFKYYYDGILNEEMTQTRDVSLSANKSFKVEVTGKTGEKKQVAINVESVATGKTGTYMEFEVDFGETEEDKPKYEILQQNSKIFKELSTPDSIPVEETDEPVPETDEPDVPTIESEEQHNSEPTSEPDTSTTTSEPTGAIPVD